MSIWNTVKVVFPTLHDSILIANVLQTTGVNRQHILFLLLPGLV